MSHTARIEDLTAAQADEVASEWRQLGATQIQRIAQPDGRFTMTCVFPGSPFATDDAAEVLQPAPQVRAARPMPVRQSKEFELLAPEYRQQFDACVSEPETNHSSSATTTAIEYTPVADSPSSRSITNSPTR